MDNQTEPKRSVPLRDLKRERKPTSSIGFIQVVIIPGFWGILAAFILGKVMPFFVGAIIENRMKNSLSRFLKEFNKDADALLSFQFNETNLWVVVLVGFALGVFLRFAFFGDEDAK